MIRRILDHCWWIVPALIPIGLVVGAIVMYLAAYSFDKHDCTLKGGELVLVGRADICIKPGSRIR